MVPRLYQKRFRVCFCAGMVLFALLVRLASSPQAVRTLYRQALRLASDARLANAILFLETGVTLQPEQTSIPETDAPTAATDATAEAPTQSETRDTRTQLTFAEQEAQSIGFRGNCTYSVDKSALLTAPLTWETPQAGPQVLIVHTHTSEAYTPSEGYAYESVGNYRTLDETRNVIAVGNVLAKELEQAGLEVVHDTSYHDQPSYDNSYYDAKDAIEAYLAQYPSIVMVIDVHRDAAENEDGTQVCETVQPEGEDCARVMLVVGTNEGGLTHPDWQENLSCALKVQALANRLAPGLMKKLSLRTERFNQHETPGSMLVEIGGAGNTLPQALRAAQYFGKAVAQLLRAYQPQ